MNYSEIRSYCRVLLNCVTRILGTRVCKHYIRIRHREAIEFPLTISLLLYHFFY